MNNNFLLRKSMYSKKNKINNSKEQNNFSKLNRNLVNNLNLSKENIQKNYLTNTGNNNNSYNYDYLKEYYKYSKRQKNINRFYIKKNLGFRKTYISKIDKESQKKEFFNSINNGKTKKEHSILNGMNHLSTISYTNINEFDCSKDINKSSFLDNLTKFNYNNNGYNTINNLRFELNLDSNNSNTYSSISSYRMKKKIVNNNEIIKGSKINYFKIKNKIKTNRDNLRKSYLYKSTPNLSKFLNLISDNSNYYSKENINLETISDKNKLTISSTINNKTTLNNQILNRSNLKSKRHRSNKTKYDTYKIRKEVEFAKNEFENMRKIEKSIKKYFIDNGVSIKNRELYHQSAIIIQSNFRSFLVYKKVKLFLKFSGICDVLNKIFLKTKSIYFHNFIENAKIYNNLFDKDETNSINKTTLNNNYTISYLKIESLNNFSIINNKNNNNKIEQNLSSLSKKLEKENKILKNRLSELEIQIKKLKKENENYKLREKQFNNNILSDNQIDIHKIKENIENVSKELEEMKSAKKNSDIISLSYNFRNYININDKTFNRSNSTNSNSLDIIYKNKNSKEFKQMHLKNLILLRTKKNNSLKKYYFYKFSTNIKIEELKEIIQFNKLKIFLDMMNYKLKQNFYLFFFKLQNKILHLKFNKAFLYTKNKNFKDAFISKKEN